MRNLPSQIIPYSSIAFAVFLQNNPYKQEQGTTKAVSREGGFLGLNPFPSPENFV
jgi:hypothetical protein